MTEYCLAVEIAFTSVPHGSDEQFEAFLDEVYAQLENIDRDVSLAARLVERVASFAITVDSENPHDDEARFLVDLRTALHAAGVATHDWPQFVIREQNVRELQDA